MGINIIKINIFFFEKDTETMECKISANGKILEQVNKVVHLGSMFSRDGRYEKDVERRIAASNRVNGCNQMLFQI